MFSGIDTDKDAGINTQAHALSAVKVLSYPEQAAAKYNPSLAVNDWYCVCAYIYFTLTIVSLPQLTRAHY